MKRVEKKLDNYYTKKVIEKIREKLALFYIDLIFEESKNFKGKETIYISINLRGKKALKNPRNIMEFFKDESVTLLFDNSFYKTIRKKVETELEMISKGE